MPEETPWLTKAEFGVFFLAPMGAAALRALAALWIWDGVATGALLPPALPLESPLAPVPWRNALLGQIHGDRWGS